MFIQSSLVTDGNAQGRVTFLMKACNGGLGHEVRRGRPASRRRRRRFAVVGRRRRGVNHVSMMTVLMQSVNGGIRRERRQRGGVGVRGHGFFRFCGRLTRGADLFVTGFVEASNGRLGEPSHVWIIRR